MDYIDRFTDRVGCPVGVVTGTFLSLGAMAPDSLARPIVVCLVGVVGSMCGSLIVDMIRRELDRAERERREDAGRGEGVLGELRELRSEVAALRARIEAGDIPIEGGTEHGEMAHGPAAYGASLHGSPRITPNP